MGSGRARKFAAGAVAVLLLAAMSAVLVATAASKPRPLKYACASNLYNAKKVLKYVARPSACKGPGKTLVNFKADDPVYTCRKEHGGFAAGQRQRRFQYPNGIRNHGPAGLMRLVKKLSDCAPVSQPNETPITLPQSRARTFCAAKRGGELRWVSRASQCDSKEFPVVLAKSSGNPVANADSASTDEDHGTSVAVLANDKNTPSSNSNAGLQVSSVDTTGTKGTVTVNPDGTIAYDTNGKFESLKVGATATDTFKYRAKKGAKVSGPATVTVTVTGVNDAPVATGDTATTDREHLTQISVLSNDSDTDGDSLSPGSLDTAGTKGQVTINGNGTIKYDPNHQFDSLGPNQSEHDTFKYKANDGHANSNAATVDVTVTGVNQPPVLSDIETTALAYDTGSGGTAITSTLKVAEPDGTNLVGATVKITSGFQTGKDTLSYAPALGIAPSYNSGTGVLTLTGSAPASDYQQALRDVKYAASAPTASGSRTISFQVDDGAPQNHASNSTSRNITLTHVNHAPSASNDTGSAGEDAPNDLTVLSNDSDIDGDTPLHVSSVDTTGTLGTVAINGDGTIKYDPNGAFESLKPGDTATDTFKYKAADPSNLDSNAATVTVTINGANDAPVLANVEGGALAYGTGSGDAQITNAITVADVDNANLKTAKVQISTGYVNGKDTLSFTNELSVTNGGFDTTTGTLTLNTPAGGVGKSDWETVLRHVKYSASASTPAGNRTISFQIDDAQAANHASNIVSRSVTVNHVNHAPAAADDTGSSGEDASSDLTVLSNDSDVDGDTPLHVSSVDTTGTLGTVAINGDGTIKYDPNGAFESLKPGDTGSDTFKYKAADPSNLDSNAATVTVTINGANDAPVLANVEGGALAYGTGSGDAQITNAITVADVDNANLKTAKVQISSGYVNGKDTLSFTNELLVSNGGFDTTTGTLTLNTPAGGVGKSDWETVLRDVKFATTPTTPAGNRTISFQIDDAQAANNLSNVPTRAITVNHVNHAPTAADDSDSTSEDASKDIAVLSNDSDIDGDTPLHVSSVDTTGTLGTAAINGDGTIKYDPNGAFESLKPGDTATDTFKYKAADPSNLDSNAATVTVTINGANDAPVLANVEGTALAYDTGSGDAQITNAITVADVDNANLKTAKVQISSGYVNGKDTLSFTNELSVTNGGFDTTTGTLTLNTPAGGVGKADWETVLRDVKFASSAPTPSGSRTISFQIDDAQAANNLSNVPTRAITVTHVNHAPTAVADNDSTSEDASKDIAVLGNDSDIDNDALSVSSIDSTGTTGTVTDNGDGTIKYDPNGQFESLNVGQTGSDSFKYKAKDPSNVDSNEVTVDVTINGANDAPTLSGIEGTALAYDTGDPGTPITSTLSVADIDDANLKSGSVDISLGYVDGADTLSSTGTANITANWSAATHILTLSTDTGGAPKSEWDTALRSVKFFSAGPTPSGTRKVSFQVDDGHAVDHASNVATRDITVTNDNVAPTDIALSQDTVATGQPSGAAVGTLSSTDADLGDSHTYTLVSGTGDDDNGKFQISGSTLQTSQALTAGDYKVRVQTDDGRGGTFQKAFTIHAIDDAPPTDISLSNDTVAENQPLGTDIGTLTTTDADGGPTFTYTLVAGNGTNDADNNDFQINGDILEVKNPPNFEADATRQVYIRSDDGKGAHIDKAFTINVTNVNEAPTSVLLDNSSVAENQPAATTIGNLSATDPDAGDAASMTFTLAAGVTDNDKFQITGNVLKTGQSFNFEAQSSYTVTVTAKDTGNLTKDQAFPITITNVNETPAVTAGATLGYTENQAPQQVDNTITVTEPDGTNLSSASASITGNFQSGEDVLSWVDNDGLDSITLQPSTNQTINLSGPGTAAQYAAALKAVKYNNTSEAPTTAARTVTFSVTDPTALTGSATSTINVTSVDDPPDAVNDPGGAVTLAQTTVLEDANATAIPVLNNDTDVDAGLKEITAIGATSDGATVTGTGGSANHWTGLTYKPALNYCNSPDTTASADPETFTYTLNGGDTATVSMTVTCVNDAPVADDETFNGANSAVGNTTFVSNDPDDGAPTTPDPTDTGPSAAGRPHKTITGDILAGDTDVDGPGPLTVKDTDGTPDSLSHQTTTGGGTVAIEPDGDFVYEPKPNASSCPTSDTFTYTVKDAFSPTPGEGTGTVTIEIAGCVWYVNNNDAGGDNGTSEKPYDNLGEAQAVADSGDSIFVYQGSSTPTTNQYAGGFDLLASQKLVGEAATLTAGSPAATLHSSDASNRPTLTDNNANVVNLDDSNTVAGVGIDPQGTGGGIAGASGDTGGGTIDDVQIADNGTAGTLPGLELDSTTGTFNISNLTVNNGDNNSATSTDSGIRLNNAGTVNFASTGTISVTTNSAKGLDATNGAGTTNMGTGSVFDDVTVTNSGSGGVNLNGTTGATQLGNGAGTDLSLTTTSGTAPALKVSNGGTVSVPGAGTANLTSAGGPAADVTGTSGATFDLDTVTANTSGTAEDGINLAGLVTGTFTATGGTLTGGSGIEFDLDGGSGTITYPGTFADTPNGKTAEITGRTSGAVSFSGAINDSTAGAGGGITVGGAGALSNTGGSTTFSNSSKKLDTGASNAVTLSNSDGHTLNLTNGLDVTTTSGKGVEATSSGTLNIPSGGTNTIVTGSGKGLEVQNTDVAATPLTFEKIAGNGANAGILLNNTGANNALTVTGTGGTCSNADSSGCTGGTIQNTTGADDAGNTPPGTAVVLNSTKGVSLTRMRLADNSNYGMRGNSVSGLTFNNSVVNGSNGTSVLTANKDSSMRFTELTGTVGMSNTDIAGGLFSNLIVINTSGPALNATLDSVDSLGMNTATGADNAVLFEGTGSATTNVSFTNGSVTSARGQMLHYIGDGTGGGNLTLTNDNFINGNPLTSQSTGGGGVSAVAGATGAATMDIQNNTFQNSKTNALTIIKSHDIGGASGSFSGTINNNTIGTAGTANSGSSEGDGMEITNEGTGNMTVAVTNNHVHQINSSGFQFVAGAGIASSGQFNINFSGNSVDNPGNNGSVTLLQSVRIDSGVTSGDTFATCANFGANTITGSSDAANKDFRLVVNQSTTIRLPGYAGGSTDGTAVAAFVAGKIGSGAQGTAVANSPGTFTGSGATCP